MGVDVEMRCRLPRVISEADLITAAYRLSEAVGRDNFWLSSDEDLRNGVIMRALMRPEPDDCFVPKEDQSATWLKVSTLSRYYGEGYERGSIWAWIAVAEWLERNLHADVFYGGDSGEGIERFGKTEREAVIAHWAQHGHRPYFQSEWRKDSAPEKPICPLCQQPATRYGIGQTYAMWSCDGCGRRWEWKGGDVKRVEVADV